MAVFTVDQSTRINVGSKATAPERTAAEELQTFLAAAFGGEMRHFGLTSAPETRAISSAAEVEDGIVLGTPASSELVRMLAGKLSLIEVHGDGFVISPQKSGKRSLLIVAATEPKGVLNGAYRLLEELGADFFPVRPRPPGGAAFSVSREIREVPAFSIRAGEGPIPYLARNRMNAVGYPASMSMVYLDEFERLGWRGRFADDIERSRRAFGGFLATAAEFGMKVYLSGVEHWWPDELVAAYPEFAHPETRHVFCPSRDNWLLFARARLEELLRSFEGVWGYRLTLADICRQSPFMTCPACAHIPPDERLVELVRELSAAAGAAGTRLIVRTWGMDWRPEALRRTRWGAGEKWDPVTGLFRLDEAAPPEVIFEMKNSWGEDAPLSPGNPWAGEFPARAKLVSFYAAGGDYRGENAMPCPSVEPMKSRMTELASLGIRGVIAVGAPLASEEPAEEPVGGRLGRLNSVAFMRMAWDPSAPERDVRRRWAAAEFAGAAEEMAEIIRATAEPTLKTLNVRSQRASLHSGIPESFARMQECMTAYGFNDCGGSLPRDALRFTPQNADAAVREKNEAVAAFEATLAMVKALSGRLPENLWKDLCRLFEFSRDYAAIWRSVVEAYFLAGILEAAPDRAEQCRRRLARLAGSLVDAALALGENSDLVPPDGLWGGEGAPILTGNIRSAIRVLVEMELKPRLSARDAPRARAP